MRIYTCVAEMIPWQRVLILTVSLSGMGFDTFSECRIQIHSAVPTIVIGSCLVDRSLDMVESVEELQPLCIPRVVEAIDLFVDVVFVLIQRILLFEQRFSG